MRRLHLLLAAAVLALVAACGSTPTVSAPPTLGPLGPITVASADISVTPIPLGLDADGAMAVPPLDHPEQASWYALGPQPGDPGPAIVLGHVNAHGVPGVFSRLHEVQVGDEVTVQRGATTLRFTVYDTVLADKDDFPVARVFADTAGPELRLITCGGTLDRAAHSYESNVIVFARAAT